MGRLLIAESPFDAELYRSAFRSVTGASQSSARMLQLLCASARCRVRAFDCSFFGSTSAASATAEPVYVSGANTDLHMINSSILSTVTGTGTPVAVDITISTSVGTPNVMVSNSTPFAVGKVTGPLRYAPTPFDGANLIETGLTMQQALRLISAFGAGKLSGMGSGTLTYRNAVADSANRMVVTVDSSGNRTAITYTLT